MSDARLALWLAPVAAPAPEPRFHPAYETVRAETAKLDSPAAGPPDWSAVLSAGDEFLREVGKDLVVATSLCIALCHREGARGLATGLALVTALARLPETAPSRPRARANALAFLVARAESAWDARPIERDRTVIDAMADAIGALSACASEMLGSDAPSFRGLADRAERARESVPSAVPVSAPALPSAPPEPKAVFAPPPAALASEAPTTRPDSIPTQLRKSAAALAETAVLMRASSPLDGEAMRVLLAALYLPMTSVPPVSRGARTALPPPSKLSLDAITRLSTEDAAPEVIVREVLAALERSRLALDLHLHLARALDRAGEAGASAKRAHRHELTGLHLRLPELATLEFNDGTPFAASGTRELLDGLVRTPEAPSVAAATTSPMQAARELALEGRLSEALALASRARAESPSGRVRFEATLGLAALAEQARAMPLAEELHAALLRELDERRIDAWEPELAVAALVAHLRFARAIPSKESLAKALFGRLAVLDPAAALALTPPASPAHATPPKTVR